MPVPLNEGLFQILHQSIQTHSHVIVRVLDDKSNKHQLPPSCAKRQLSNGLIKNQSYIVLQAKLFEHMDKTFHLIKLCNPWKRLNQMLFAKCKEEVNRSKENERGLNDGKWNGSWSEHSPEWINLSDEVKIQYGLILENDSHFWMLIENFVDTFTAVTICHFSKQTFQTISTWHAVSFHGYWITDLSAGGCYHEKTFHKNPIYLVSIHRKSAMNNTVYNKTNVEVPKVIGNSVTQYTVLVSLMQKYRNSKRVTGISDLKIGFHIFKLKSEDRKYIQEVIYDEYLNSSKINYEKVKVRLKIKPEFFHLKKGEQALKFFTNVREVSARYKLSEGNYLIIPSTYGPNCDGNFLLRLFSEISFGFPDKFFLWLEPSGINVDKQIKVSKTLSDQMFSRPLNKITSKQIFKVLIH